MICDPSRQVECIVSLSEGCGLLGFVSFALNTYCRIYLNLASGT